MEAWVESDAGQETITQNLDAVAKLMGVPEDDRARFCFEMWWYIGYATIGPALDLQKGHTKDVALQDAELKIRAAYKAVARLCGCKEKYQDFNFGTGIEPKGLEECEDVLRNLVAAFAVMTNSDWRPLTNSGPGSRGLNKNWMFENFVATLFSKSARTGRRLTFSRHNGTGTVLEAIRLLAPLLPPGFVPGPGALINSVRRAKKMAEEHAVWEREWEKEDLKKVGKKTFLRVKAWDQMKEEFESWQKKKGKGLTS